jgi:TetR/AcrR family transcriptional repressor of nem operon
MRIASCPLTWYWKCGASQLSVPAIGLTSFDQRQPGSKTRRPTSPPPTRAAIEASVPEAPGRLAAYAELYATVLRDRRMCLCGILAAEYQTLPERMREAVIRFFDENEAWLERVLEEGRRAGTTAFAGSPRDTARLLVSGLERAMLVARSYHDPDRFTAAADQLLAGLTPR